MSPTTPTIRPAGRRRRTGLVAFVVMTLGAVVMVYPYAYMLGSSLKTRNEFATDKRSLVPPRFQISERIKHAAGKPSALDWNGADWPILKNYADALVYGQVDVFLFNSLIYAVVVTVVQLAVNTLAAYAFARLRLPAKRSLGFYTLATQMVPPVGLVIPYFLILNQFL